MKNVNEKCSNEKWWWNIGSQETFEEKTSFIPLPEEFFDKTEPDSDQPLKPMHGCSFNIFNAIGNAFIDVNQVDFSFRPTAKKNGQRKSSHLWFQYWYYNEKWGTNHSVYIWNCKMCWCWWRSSGHWWKTFYITSWNFHRCDKFKFEWSKKEQPLLFSILNTAGDSYRMNLLGFVPINFPYSDDTLAYFLKKRGYTKQSHIHNIIMHVKRNALLTFVFNVFKPIVEDGNNCFKVGLYFMQSLMKKH